MARAVAQANIADQRRTLVHQLDAVIDAMENTRVERIHAAAAGHPDGAWLRELLGDPPAHAASRGVWSRIAAQLDTDIDDPHAAGDYLIHRARAALAGNADAAHEIRAFAQRAIDNAGRPRTPVVGLGLHAQAAPEHHRRPPDRGIDLGL